MVFFSQYLCCTGIQFLRVLTEFVWLEQVRFRFAVCIRPSFVILRGFGFVLMPSSVTKFRFPVAIWPVE